jgi:hypothetical protein
MHKGKAILGTGSGGAHIFYTIGSRSMKFIDNKKQLIKY